MDTLFQRIQDIGWWIDGFRGIILPLIILSILPKLFKRLKKVPRWMTYRRSLWLMRTRHNPVAVQRFIAKSQTYKLLFFIWIPLAFVILGSIPKSLDPHTRSFFIAIFMSPVMIFEILWLSHASRVNDLVKSNDIFRRHTQ